jgi:hypothetical protein
MRLAHASSGAAILRRFFHFTQAALWSRFAPSPGVTILEAARRSAYPETFEMEALAHAYIVDTPVEGGRPWIRRLVKPIWGSFLVTGSKDVIPK